MLRRWWCLSCAFCLGLPNVLVSQVVDAESVAGSLDTFIQRGMRAWNIPGLSVAVVRNDSVLLAKGYGVRELGTGESVNEHTLFGIMSTTKAMTAAGVAMLVDDGAVQWNDHVTKWIPEFVMPDPYVTRELTVVDLLTHRAGLGNADLLWVRGDVDEPEIFRRVRYLEPAYSLRAGYTYQNIMYGLAGEVIERASGMSFGEFLRRRLWEPLGMKRTFASLTDVRMSGDRNVSSAHYDIRDTIRAIADESVDVLASAGAVWSTTSDMALWVRFLLDSARVNGERLIGEESFSMLFRPHTIIPQEQFYPTAQRTRPHWTTYGLGWFQQDYRGHAVAFHTGSLDGRIAIVGLLPDQRFGIVVLANLDHAEFRHAVMLQAFDLQIGGAERNWSNELLELYGGIVARADSAHTREESRRVTGTQPTQPLSVYAGTYTHRVWGDMVLWMDDGRLWGRMGTNPQLRGPLSHWHYDTFRAHLGDGRSDPEWVHFVIGPDGEVTELRFGRGEEMVFERVPES